MRTFAKIAYGVGAAAVIYFCIDILILSSGHGMLKHDPPKSSSAPMREDEFLPVEQTPTHIEVAPRPIVEERSGAAPTASAPLPARPPAQHFEPDRSLELAATLEAQYAVDMLPTRESLSKERALEALFSQPELGGKGHLEEVKCRGTICRGVIRITNDASDNEVFTRTFLSSQFMNAIQDAVSVTSREKQADGSIVATFYIHPQSVFQMVAQ
jgi:hypothetical protein